jgi:glycosyltransferase involved in cell wall biosynthesis
MKVTWLVPDVYGFLLDEIESLRAHLKSLRVISGCPVPQQVRQRFPHVEFHDCPEQPLLPFGTCSHLFLSMAKIHGWRRLVTSRWHTRKIAGMYKVLLLEESRERSDVIHSHFAYPGGIGGTAYPAAAQVLTLRGYDILTTGSYGSLWNPFFRKNLMHSFGEGIPVTCGTRYSAHRARQILGSRADIRFLSQGLPSFSFQPAYKYTRRSLGIPDDAIVLLSVGNLVQVKNLQFLLQVFAKLIEQSKTRPFLVLCGDGPLAPQLKAFATSQGIANYVRFLGRLPRGELTDIFELSNLLVHTSMSEGFGNVIPEAMLHRLLVVASPVGVAPELICHGENGYLPELGDLRSWTTSLKQALAHVGDFKQKAEANRKTVLDRHSMDARIEGFVRIYLEVLERKRRLTAPKDQ